MFHRTASGEWATLPTGIHTPERHTFQGHGLGPAVTLLILGVTRDPTGCSRIQRADAIELRSPNLRPACAAYPNKFIVCDLEEVRSNLEHLHGSAFANGPVDDQHRHVQAAQRLGMIIDNQRLKAYGISVNKCEPEHADGAV